LDCGKWRFRISNRE